MNKMCNFKSNKGFTLIEVMVALAVMSIVFSGIITMLVDSQKMQVKSNALDKLNMTVSSYIEMLRYSTNDAISDLELIEDTASSSSETMENGSKKENKSYYRNIYLNTKLQEVEKAYSEYSISIVLNSNSEETRESFLIPDMQNKRYKHFDLWPSTNDYIFWVLPALENRDQQNSGVYTERNYELVVINGEKAKSFKDLQDYVVDWAQKTYPLISARECAWSRQEILSSSEKWKFLFAEIRNSNNGVRQESDISQYDIDEQSNNFVNVRGSIPVRVEYDQPPNNGKPYNYYVVNEFPATIDFYLISDEESPLFNVECVKGLANITHLKPDKDKKMSYDFTVVVRRTSEETNLIEYKSGYYYAD